MALAGGRWLSALSVDELTRIRLDALRKRYFNTYIAYIIGSSILGAGEGLLRFLGLILRVVCLCRLACSWEFSVRRMTRDIGKQDQFSVT